MCEIWVTSGNRLCVMRATFFSRFGLVLWWVLIQASSLGTFCKPSLCSYAVPSICTTFCWDHTSDSRVLRYIRKVAAMQFG